MRITTVAEDVFWMCRRISILPITWSRKAKEWIWITLIMAYRNLLVIVRTATQQQNSQRNMLAWAKIGCNEQAYPARHWRIGSHVYPCHWARVTASGLFWDLWPVTLDVTSPSGHVAELKWFKHFKIEFESNTQNHLNGGQWSWFRCLWNHYLCTTSS